MRLTDFWDRMRQAFGGDARRAEVFAQDHVLGALGNRTVAQALAEGRATREVWHAVCAEMQLPAALR